MLRLLPRQCLKRLLAARHGSSDSGAAALIELLLAATAAVCQKAFHHPAPHRWLLVFSTAMVSCNCPPALQMFPYTIDMATLTKAVSHGGGRHPTELLFLGHEQVDRCTQGVTFGTVLQISTSARRTAHHWLHASGSDGWLISSWQERQACRSAGWSFHFIYRDSWSHVSALLIISSVPIDRVVFQPFLSGMLELVYATGLPWKSPTLWTSETWH